MKLRNTMKISIFCLHLEEITKTYITIIFKPSHSNDLRKIWEILKDKVHEGKRFHGLNAGYYLEKPGRHNISESGINKGLN